MTIEKHHYGSTADGSAVELFLIETETGYRLALTNFGARIVSLQTPDRNGASEEITLGFKELAPYLEPNPYYGATVGRYANRIAGGSFRLGMKTVRLHCNEGENHLHGGHQGFDSRLWSAELIGDSEAAGVRFARVSPDKEERYPGELTVELEVTLSAEGELRLVYTAETTKTTPVNLTNHAYFNLGGPNSKSILDHRVEIDAAYYLPVDENSIPTGELREVAGGPFDFRRSKAIGDEIDAVSGGYDHCFVFSREEPVRELRSVARVYEPASGRRVEVLTTKPGMQLYSGNKLAGKADRHRKKLPARSALCLETQHFPNAVNEPAFPQPFLEPNETYRHETVYRFSASR